LKLEACGFLKISVAH